jgi:hypothetical protein
MRRPERRSNVLGKAPLRLRVAVLALGLAALGLLAASGWSYRSESAASGARARLAPDSDPALVQGFGTRGLLVATASAGLGALILALAILESQKTAGAEVSLRRAMERFGPGNLTPRAHLRKDDNLHRLAESFNDLAERLGERRRRELEVVQAAAADARVAAGPFGESAAERLDALAAAWRAELGQAAPAPVRSGEPDRLPALRA